MTDFTSSPSPAGRPRPAAIRVNGQLFRVVRYQERRDLAAAWRTGGQFRALWDVQLEDGRWVTVYRDRVNGRWHVV